MKRQHLPQLLGLLSLLWFAVVILGWIGAMFGDCALNDGRCLFIHENAQYILIVGLGLQFIVTILVALKQAK